MIRAIYSEKESLNSLFKRLRDEADTADLDIQKVFSNHVVLKTGGFLENSIKAIFKEYCTRNGNSNLASFVEYHVGRMNSLNDEKLEILFRQFGLSDVWNEIVSGAPRDEIDALSSVKGIRDNIAHGRDNGTGLSRTIDYFNSVQSFVDRLEQTLVPDRK